MFILRCSVNQLYPLGKTCPAYRVIQALSVHEWCLMLWVAGGGGFGRRIQIDHLELIWEFLRDVLWKPLFFHKKKELGMKNKRGREVCSDVPVKQGVVGLKTRRWNLKRR